MLHFQSTVSCFILEVANYEPLVYHGLLRTIGFETVFVFKSWYHMYSTYIYDNFVSNQIKSSQIK